jgi:Uma2 family endonuclease
MAERKLERMTADEFLVWQTSQDRNYELVDGVPVLPLKAMTGASRAHDRVVVNLLRELANQLRRKPCQPTTDAIALRIPAGNIRRPDVVVECGGTDPKGTLAVEARLVVEVLSPSTMNFDRVRKLDEYKSVPSLRYILLVDTEKPQMTLHVRDAAGWTPRHHETLDAVLDLPDIGATLAARDVFEGLPFAP